MRPKIEKKTVNKISLLNTEFERDENEDFSN